MSSKMKLTTGLSKLHDANETIAGLKTKLVELQPVLQQKTVQIKELISKLTQD
jgi:dynein heavy chain